MDNTIQQWNEAARLYSESEETNPFSRFCREFISDHFSHIEGQTVLDAGCGNGEYMDILAKNGGIVSGCDASAEMLKLAQERYPFYPYCLADFREKLPYGDNTFDLVFCNLVLMDMDPIDNAITEFYRVTKVTGHFFFSIVHPAFFLPDWERDEQGVGLYKKVARYITPHAEPQALWSPTTHYHRPVSFYLNQMASTGFILNEMFEPYVYRHPQIRDIPLYLFAEFRKQ